MFFQYADATPVQMVPGLIRKTLVSGDKLMICRFDLDRGVEIPSHSHPHDQAGYVVLGKIRIAVDGKVAISAQVTATPPHPAPCTRQ